MVNINVAFIISLILVVIVLIFIGYLAGYLILNNKISRNNDNDNQETLDKSRQKMESVVAEHIVLLKKELQEIALNMSNYAKQEFGRTLRDEIKNYKTSLAEAQQVAIDLFVESHKQVERQQTELTDKLSKEMAEEKQRRLTQFEDNMADVISYYVQTAVGENSELHHQLPGIMADLRSKKSAIIEDINHGA
jgi:predicted PurR-regulated permease PerM